MQHVNSVGKGGDVDHPVCSRRVADSDLPNARADRRHRLPITEVATRLDEVELVASVPASLFGEVSQPIERVSLKRHPLERHGASLYLYRYKMQATTRPAASGDDGAIPRAAAAGPRRSRPRSATAGAAHHRA